MGRPITKGPWLSDCVGDIEGADGEPVATTDGCTEQDVINAGLIALAGTVANQLFDAGLDGIEAVKALPELARKYEALLERVKNLSQFRKSEDVITGLALLDRLKGDAK